MKKNEVKNEALFARIFNVLILINKKSIFREEGYISKKGREGKRSTTVPKTSIPYGPTSTQMTVVTDLTVCSFLFIQTQNSLQISESTYPLDLIYSKSKKFKLL